MPPSQKLITTIWTTLLAAPTWLFTLAYARMECGEMEPCSTGGPMPYSAHAYLFLLLLSAVHLAFLIMIWRLPALEE